MDVVRNGFVARVARGAVTAGAVLGIVAASMIGLHDWADEAAVHVGAAAESGVVGPR